MSNLTASALNLQRILDVHGIEGLAQSLARKDERIQSAHVERLYTMTVEIVKLKAEIERLGRLLDHRPLPTTVVGWWVGY